MSKKKEALARKKLLSMPWWKVKDNWFFIAVLLILVGIVGLTAL